MAKVKIERTERSKEQWHEIEYGDMLLKIPPAPSLEALAAIERTDIPGFLKATLTEWSEIQWEDFRLYFVSEDLAPLADAIAELYGERSLGE